LADGFHRRLGKSAIPAQHFGIADDALFINGGFDLDCALDMSCERALWVLWLYPLDQKPFRDTLGKFHRRNG
jgi:hypothetical protein